MGTSLTGLTPSTTYDALIKVGDNGPLSATAKVLSDGLGNDSPLAMSTTLVGIGTTTPSEKLEIQNGSTGAGVKVSNSGGGFAKLAISSNASSVAELSFTNSLGITGGNVGVGTTAPESKLHVVDGVSGGIVSVFVDNNINALNSTAQIKFTVDAGGSITNGGAAIQAVNVDPNFANTDLVFRNSGNILGNLAESMRITNTGNVGIGTSAPTTLISGTERVLQISNSNIASLYLTSTGTGTIATTVNSIRNYAIYDVTASTTRATFTANGLCFNNDTAAANALDDYEEGTWTPIVTFGNASVGVSYSFQEASYTKIGRQVTASGVLVLASKGSSTGDARIGGLPFTVGSALNKYCAVTLRFIDISFTGQFQGESEISSTNIALSQTTLLGSRTTITDTNFANNSNIMLSITYFV